MFKFLIRKRVQVNMNYKLNNNNEREKKQSFASAARKLWRLVPGETPKLVMAMTAVILNSFLNLLSPFLVGYAIDHYFPDQNFQGIVNIGMILIGVYLMAFVTHFLQVKLMGGLGQRLLFTLRNVIFAKLQALPLAFFNQNKAGDLISRINNDTDNLNQFFSQSLMQFIGSIFIMTGAAVFILVLNLKLALFSLIPAVFMLIFTKLVSPWVKSKNTKSLQKIGGLSAEIQESLSNFKVIVAFNRRNYFRDKFNEVNEENYLAAKEAGVANNIFTPGYTLGSSLAQLVVFSVGVYMISKGELTVGLLIGFIMYMSKFYDPVRQLAAVWASFQTAMAAWDRISKILSMESDMPIIVDKSKHGQSLLELDDVSFHYPNGKQVLTNVNISLERGKIYALVGPTGGGKTTTASLMARLFDPTSGKVLLDGKDIRSYDDVVRTKKIGFILQEPYLFTGNIRENIVYGDDELSKMSVEDLDARLKETNLDHLASRFEKGLDTAVLNNGDSISLGQRQLIAFIRAVLRKPDLLILDEATANIDTVTEQLLEEVLAKLPQHTTRVVIAHRLNTIQNADEIFFVNSGEVTMAGSLEHAVEMLLNDKRKS